MVWMDVEGDELLFNTAEGRRKPDNIRRDPRVVVSVHDRNHPQAYAVFHGRGRVTDAGADEHIGSRRDASCTTVTLNSAPRFARSLKPAASSPLPCHPEVRI
jgi:Pyridoxamine 5'-phosphate oxidase